MHFSRFHKSHGTHHFISTLIFKTWLCSAIFKQRCHFSFDFIVSMRRKQWKNDDTLHRIAIISSKTRYCQVNIAFIFWYYYVYSSLRRMSFLHIWLDVFFTRDKSRCFVSSPLRQFVWQRRQILCLFNKAFSLIRLYFFLFQYIVFHDASPLHMANTLQYRQSSKPPSNLCWFYTLPREIE